MRKLLIALVAIAFVVVGGTFAGPLSSGALWLLLPTHHAPTNQDRLSAQPPRHKGGIDLGTGLYIRNDEDLSVPGTPALVLRRTYLSGYRVSREFGVGTTHNGELYLVGDPDRFQWVALILPNGTRIRFERVSWGTSYFNAMFEHHASPSEWQGARLGWIGAGWALRRTDGTLMRFQACVSSGPPCSIVEERDAEGHVIHYQRDGTGQLSRIEAAQDRWIAFDYDVKKRIVRAYDSTANEVRYEYDSRGRLSHVTSKDGTERRYGYTERDEMAMISDPGIRIENTYGRDGRCTQQLNYISGSTEPYTFDFAYVVKNGAVVQTASTESDGTWMRYTYASNGYIESQAWARVGAQPVMSTYERNPVTNAVVAVVVTCFDGTGRLTRQASPVRDGNEDLVEWALLRRNCAGVVNGDDRATGWPQVVGV